MAFKACSKIAFPKDGANVCCHWQRRETSYLRLSLPEPGLLRYHPRCPVRYCIAPPARGLTLKNGTGGVKMKEDVKYNAHPVRTRRSSGPTFTV